MQNAVNVAEATSLTINDVCEAYLADRRDPHSERPCKHPVSIGGHLVAVRKEWGAWTLTDFRVGSKARIKAKCAEWREAGLAQSTIRKRISFLKTALRFAVEEEIITREQEPIIKLPKNGPPRERFVHPLRELPALLKAADAIQTPDHIRLMLELALRTGQRRGAILALTWGLIDFEQRVIRFRDTEAPEERSKKRRTDQPMDDDLLRILTDAKERAESNHVIEWRGAPVKSTYAGIKALYKRAGISGLHIHDLRRSSATYVHEESGGDKKQAAGFIGDTEAVADRHYIQDNPAVRMPAVKSLANVLARARAA